MELRVDLMPPSWRSFTKRRQSSRPALISSQLRLIFSLLSYGSFRSSFSVRMAKYTFVS
jgi:hypothetical protein